jgi:hypothetical protein
VEDDRDIHDVEHSVAEDLVKSFQILDFHLGTDVLGIGTHSNDKDQDKRDNPIKDK